MHELPITEEMLSLVLREAENAGAKKVLRINLIIGELSSVSEDAVRFYWESLAKDTLAAEAVLSFRTETALGCCRHCGRIYQPEARDQRCPNCGNAWPEITAGQDFRVESLDVD